MLFFTAYSGWNSTHLCGVKLAMKTFTRWRNNEKQRHEHVKCLDQNCTLGATQIYDRNMEKLVNKEVLTLKVLLTRLQKKIKKESFTSSLKS